MPKYAAVGFVYKDGSFTCPEHGKLGLTVGYKSSEEQHYGIRNVREAQEELNKELDLDTSLFYFAFYLTDPTK